MMIEITLIGIVCIFMVMFLLGYLAGVLVERHSWKIRANGTAHHVNGRFYYITEERKP